MNILYVEDDPTAREYIEKGLREHGYTVDSVEDGTQGLEQALCGSYDLVILDVGLPEIDGFQVLNQLRKSEKDHAEKETPVLFLSARGEVSDRVKGLNLGADDYLAKPFAFAELLARIQAIARRRLGEPKDGILRISDLELDVRSHTVRRDGKNISLTMKEFSLLEYMLRNAGQALSRTMITEKVWGYGFDSYSNVIDVHITNLRKKVDRGFDQKLIHTVKGVGYILDRRDS